MSQSDLHIQEDSLKLEIFIPRNKKKQESCYAQKFPSGIFRWLMTDQASNHFDPLEKGLRITTSVLSSSRSVIPDILEYEGIAVGDFEDDYSDDEDGFSEEETSHQPTQDSIGRESTNTTVADTPGTGARTEAELGVVTPSATPSPSHTTDQAPLYTPTTSQSVNQSAQRTQSSVSDRSGAFRFQSPLGQDGDRNFYESPLSQLRTGTASSYHGNVPWESDTNVIHARSDFAAVRRRSMSEAVPRPIPVDGQRVRYVEILKSVVSAARAASFPSQGRFNMTGMSDTLPSIEMESSSYDGLEQPAGFRSTSKLERDKKIGAAGELYVFELLKKLSTALPGFSMANWRSNIREYVSEHPEYALIQPWGPRETDDIIYDDVEGTFTELLIENGYLKEAWDGKKPHYLIEVKTTTGLHDTKFYMSKAQYRRMGNHRDSTDTIYMIFRVYNADKDSVRVRVFVNPAKLEESKHLLFTAETWSVVPKDGEMPRV
ncbi:hypothetical protein EDB80DRAFT_164384 [Ilyonectria destructans]|nr:hypothetical protein EDB80DRAFT_164384 [Ilyonectria destructans]